MPTDPDIVLQAGNIGDPAKQQQGMISMFNLAQAVKGAQLQQQRTNALRDAFTNPDSVDPVTGLPTQQAIRKVMQVDPELGVKIQDDAISAQVKRAQAAHYKTEAGKANFDFMSGVAGIGYDAYTAAKKVGKSEEEAISAGQAARNDAVKNNGGIISDDTADGIIGKPFEPMGAKALAGANKEWLAEQRGEQQVIRDEKRDRDADRRGDQADRRIELLASRPAPGENHWEILTDPTQKDKSGNPVQYRYNPNTAEATTLDKKPFTPGGAAKMAAAGKGGEFSPEMGSLGAALAERGVSLPSGFRSREQQIALYQGLLKRNPDKTPDQIADLVEKGQIEFGVQKKETQVAAGIAGRVRYAESELAQNIPLVREQNAKVPRGKFIPVNKLMQTADASLSDPELKTLKVYINSLMNSYDMLAARGGTDVGKREEAHKLITSAESPEALEAGLKAFEKEVQIAKRAADESTNLPLGKLLTRVIPANSKDDYDAMDKGQWFSKPGDAPGTHRVKQ